MEGKETLNKSSWNAAPRLGAETMRNTVKGLRRVAAVLALAAPALVWAQAPAESCAPLTDRAMAADLKAATSQSRKEDVQAQARLYDEVVGLWTQAVAACDGRAKDRAQRNLADSQRVQASLAGQLGAGPQCAAAHRDASSLQDLGRQALADRRWDEASMLFRKAGNMWDLATERCTGTQHDVAQRRREQSEIDGHNAEFCAPVFERARDQTQRLRTLAPNAPREERQEASQIAETSWREAMGQCKGSVVELARNNAQAIARERGTPWTARVAPAASGTAASAPSGPTATSASSAPAEGSAARAGLAPAMPAATASTIPGAPAPAQQLAPTAAPTAAATGPIPQAAEFTAGTTRFAGEFVQEANGSSYSGTGKMTWANGDVFEGTLVRGMRHGKGRMVWASGQRYDGDWVEDRQTGQASVRFTNGNQYDGPVVDGVPQGQGRMRYASGDSYDGMLARGQPEGRGVYVWKNGQRFEGEWRAGQPSGQGKLTFANGNQYEGPLVNGQPQGRGKLTFAAGNQYEGDLAGGVPHGRGKLTFAGGNQYEGELANGVPQGEGRMTFTTGDVYTGHFTQGDPDGRGTYSWKNGDEYVGEWKAGKKHGQGALRWKNGEKWEGTFEDDEQAEESKVAPAAAAKTKG
jgi:hypothetical protein